jgi:methyl-accepting chemotaxis protein
MNLLSVPVAVIGGITLYVGLYHLFIHVKRREKNPVDLSFAVACFNMTLYDVFCVLAYNADSLAAGRVLQRYQVATLSLIGASYVAFAVAYAGVSTKKIRNAFILFFIGAALFSITDRTGLAWRLDRPLVKIITLPFGLGVTYYETEPGPFTQLISAAGVTVFVYVFLIGIGLIRRGDRRRGRPLLVSCALFSVGLINDALVQTGVYRSVYIIEYTYMAIVMMMAYVLSLEVVRSSEIRREVETAYRRLVETGRMLAGSSERVDAAAQSIDEAMNEMVSGARSQNEHIRNSHGTINDLLSDIHNISREAQQGASGALATARRIGGNIEVMKQSLDRIQSIERSVSSMSKITEDFVGHSKRINVIAEFLDETASRINVLSLNAAIEASRSGDSRSGFMIIAREVRELAAAAKTRTEQIADVIREFQAGISEVKQMIGGESDEFKRLLALTGEGQAGLDETMRLVEEEESRLRRISSKLLDLRAYSNRTEKEMEIVVDLSDTNMKTATRVNNNTVELHSKMAELSRLAESLGRMAEDRTRAATEGI